MDDAEIEIDVEDPCPMCGSVWKPHRCHMLDAHEG